MRTESQAKTIVRSALSGATGQQIPDDFFLTFNQSETGQLQGLFLGPSVMIGLDVAPRRYWRTFTDDGLYALPVHEVQNAKYDLLPIEKRKNAGLVRLQKQLIKGDLDEAEYKKRRLQRLVYWEVRRHVMEASTFRKLLVDLDTFRELNRLGKNPRCFLEFLSSEKQEEQQHVVPQERAHAHVVSLETRIRHYTLLCNRAFSHAARLRKKQQDLHESLCTF